MQRVVFKAIIEWMYTHEKPEILQSVNEGNLVNHYLELIYYIYS